MTHEQQAAVLLERLRKLLERHEGVMCTECHSYIRNVVPERVRRAQEEAQEWLDDFHIRNAHERLENYHLLFERKTMQERDDLLQRISATDLDPLILMGALRLTFAYRSELPGWYIARDRIAQRLRERGHDVSSLLTGLL